MLIQPLINSLDDEELSRGYFQQYGAPMHIARDFFLFGCLKNRVYSNRHHNLDV